MVGLLAVTLSASGCVGGRRIVLIDPTKKDEVLRVGPGVRGRAYFYNGQTWELSRTKVDYPEGFYLHFLEDE